MSGLKPAPLGGNPSFGDPQWVQAWLTHFAPGRIPVPVGPEANPAALLLPDRIRLLGVPLRVLKSPTNEHSPRYEWPVGRAGPRQAAAWLREARRRWPWEMIQLDLVPAASATLRVLLGLRPRWAVDARPFQETAWIDLHQDFDTYWAGLSRNLRAKVNSGANRLGRMGEAQTLEVAGSPDWDQWLERAMEIETEGWKGDHSSAIRQRPAEAGFYRTVLGAARAEGRLKMFFLVLDGQAVAFNLVVRAGATYYGLKTSFSEELARCSPGKVLFREVIRALMREGRCRRLDLLDPATAWKRRWGTAVESLYRIRIFARRPRPLFVFCGHRTARALRDRVQRTPHHEASR